MSEAGHEGSGLSGAAKYEGWFRKAPRVGIVISLVIVVIWAVFHFLLKAKIGDQATRGQFGDEFGMLNSLFSGLALAGVVFSLLCQTIALRMQHDEMKSQIQEMREAVERQNEANRISMVIADVQASNLILSRINMARNKWDTECASLTQQIAKLGTGRDLSKLYELNQRLEIIEEERKRHKDEFEQQEIVCWDIVRLHVKEMGKRLEERRTQQQQMSTSAVSGNP